MKELRRRRTAQLEEMQIEISSLCETLGVEPGTALERQMTMESAENCVLSDANMEAVTVASLAVPLGVRDGTVVFPCGSVVRAGPHAAKITIDGNVVAISDVLEVAWPR